jgi:methyltransferase (TIGR00027 family)
MLGLMARSLRRTSPARRERAIAQLDAIPLRVSAIDAQLEAAVAAGCTQVVILGAGLDTRALRMPALVSVDVFEVDHPATQAYKQRKTSNLRPLSRSLHFVPVDFERSSLTERLVKAGFRSTQPTVWIWEGVVMYLTDHALRRTLEQIAAACTAESVLLTTYHVPPSAPANGEMHVRRLMLSLWREPQIGLRTSESMHEAVRNVGFLVASDTRPAEWARTLGARPPTGHTADVSRLLVAKRPPLA